MKCIIALRNKANLFPANATVIQESNGWISLYLNGNPDNFIHARLMAEDGTRAVFACFATNAATETRLQALADASPNIWSLAELRADNGALASAIKALWRDIRSGDGAVYLNATMMGNDYPGRLENGT